MFSYGQIDNPLAATLPSRTDRLPRAGRFGYDHPGDAQTGTAGDESATWSWSTARCGSSSTVTCPTTSAQRRNPDGSLRDLGRQHCRPRVPLGDSWSRCRSEPKRCRSTWPARRSAFLDCARRRADADAAQRDQVRTIHLRSAALGQESDRGGRAQRRVFAPVKNAEGAAADTPTATRHALMRLHTQLAADRPAPPSSRARRWKSVPLWALDAEQVAERVSLPWTIDQPVFLTD